MGKEWRLWIDEQPRPGWANMAIDTALLERADRQGESWLRLYQWNPFCLSFGRHEPASRRYDFQRIQALGLDTVRRPTGGRAVWHAQELTYAVAAPSLRLGPLQAAYLEIHRMIADALRGLGAAVELAPPTRAAALEAGACFERAAGGEVMLAGRKIVGSAQYRHGSALLQHGSILLANDQQVVAAVTRGGRSGCSDCRIEDGSGLPEWPALAESVARAACRRWPGHWGAGPEHRVLEEAAHHYQHYQSAAWTWVR